MNPEVNYQTSIARIDELQRQAGLNRLAAEVARGRHERRRVSSVRRWRAGRTRRPSIAGRFA
ncbi:MAG TPA: hypothetical protein VJU80_06560 [Solirubrobacteraceae bacterium]|nr:hypothetical protein [Solirubrobacteraceae bacterium]